MATIEGNRVTANHISRKIVDVALGLAYGKKHKQTSTLRLVDGSGEMLFEVEFYWLSKKRGYRVERLTIPERLRVKRQFRSNYSYLVGIPRDNRALCLTDWTPVLGCLYEDLTTDLAGPGKGLREPAEGERVEFTARDAQESQGADLDRDPVVDYWGTRKVMTASLLLSSHQQWSVDGVTWHQLKEGQQILIAQHAGEIFTIRMIGELFALFVENKKNTPFPEFMRFADTAKDIVKEFKSGLVFREKVPA